MLVVRRMVSQDVPGVVAIAVARETVCAITSLNAIQATPAGLAAIIRGHWSIEDRLLWGLRHGPRRRPLLGPHP